MRGLMRYVLGFGAFLGFIVLCISLVFVRLANGPLSIDSLAPQIAEAVSSRIGSGVSVALDTVSIEYKPEGARIAVGNVALRDEAGRTLVTAPKAEVSLALAPLLAGKIQPTRFDLVEVDLRLSLGIDGSVALSAGDTPLVLNRPAPGGDKTSPENAVVSPAHVGIMQALATALDSLVEYATAPQSALGSLERIGIVRGRLTFEHEGATGVTILDGLEMSFTRQGEAAHFAVAANGPQGRWSMEVRAASRASGEHGIEMAFTDLSFVEIALALGLREPPVSFDMPVSGKGRFSFGGDGQIERANAAFVVGAGRVYFDATREASVFLDEATGKLVWDSAAQRFEIDAWQIGSGANQITFSGQASPPATDGEGWRIALEAAPGATLAPDQAGGPTLSFNTLSVAARLLPQTGRVVIERLDMQGPQTDIRAHIDYAAPANARALKVNLTAGQMPLSTVLRLWPKFAAPAVRHYTAERVKSATLVKAEMLLDFDEAAFASLGTPAPLADERMRIDFTVANVALAFVPGIPALSGFDATGRISGRTAIVNASHGILDLGNSRRLNVADGEFRMLDTNRNPAPATINARVTGSLESVSDLLGRDALKSFGGIQIDSSAMKGQMDGKLTIDMKLAKGSRAGELAVRVGAAINGFSIEKLIGKEKFEQGVLNLTFEPSGLKASGQGRMFGAAANLEIRKPSSGAPEAIVQFVIDDAARARMGLGFGAGLTGPVGARLTAPFGKEDAPAQVELDLTRAAIDGLIPGFVKPAGRPAKVSFTLDRSDGSIDIEQLSFEAPGGPAARGSVMLDANGNFRSARLSQLRLSPGDDMKVDADATKDGLKLVVRGLVVDARPFLRGLTRTETAASSRDIAASRDVDIDLKSALVTGYNRQSLSSVELHMHRRGGVIRSLQLQARSGRAAISGGTPRGREGSGALSLNSADGGALLGFLDIYRRMEGGKLTLNARLADGGLEGAIHVTDFVLRDEPALRRLVTEAAPAGDASAQKRIDTSAAQFQRLSASFVRRNGQFVVRDGILVGQQMGLKLDGTLDTIRDQVNMTGVYVPAYGLNNLFSKIPLFGPILGGEKNEGLFAVNFRINGPASSPALTINPLSAIAPGFLRKIFGAIDGTGTPPAVDEPAASPSQNMPMSISPRRN